LINELLLLRYANTFKITLFSILIVQYSRNVWLFVRTKKICIIYVYVFQDKTVIWLSSFIPFTFQHIGGHDNINHRNDGVQHRTILAFLLSLFSSDLQLLIIRHSNLTFCPVMCLRIQKRWLESRPRLIVFHPKSLLV